MVKILNSSKKTLVFPKAKIAKSITDNMLGLLVENNPKAMVFRTSLGIHTFFMKVPIDILILDDGFKVVKLKERLLPNRLFFWNPLSSIVIELPFGSIKKSKTKLGDQIKIS